jgi:hAT family C-terminal dimerisation region
MKRCLVQVDRIQSVKLNDSVNANVLGIVAESTETTRCCDEIETTYKSVYEAVATLLVLPTTKASCERCFSGLHRIKTYLRSSMGQERLNSMIVSRANLDILDSINACSAASEFASLNAAHKHQYG